MGMILTQTCFSLCNKKSILKIIQTHFHRNILCWRRLVKEVQDIGGSIEHLQRKQQEAEAQHQQLLKTRSNLEIELQIKVNSLFIDREKCLGMRRSFPINATIKY